MAEPVVLNEQQIGKVKTFANSYLYTRVQNYERNLMEYVMQAERLDKKSEAFFGIIEDTKRRQTSAVLSRVLARDDLVISSYSKPLPSSFKVFACKDVKEGSTVKVFIDVSGLIVEKNGFYNCNKIDVFCSHLLSAMTMMVYVNQPMKIIGNSTITISGTECFVALASHIFDYLRLNGYAENKNKISYIIAMYYQVNMLGLDREDQSTKNLAAKVSGIQLRDINAMEIYYEDEALTNIDALLKSLTETFKLKGMTTDIFVEKWSWFFGTGTHFGCELFTSFAKMITDAYCGSYINNQKSIEKCCGKSIVEFTTAILRVGEDVIDNGFRYESALDREVYGARGRDILREGLFGPNVKIPNEDKITVEDITGDTSKLSKKIKKNISYYKDAGCTEKEISKAAKTIYLGVIGSADINNYNNCVSTTVNTISKYLVTKDRDYIINGLSKSIVNCTKAIQDEKKADYKEINKKLVTDCKKALKVLDKDNSLLKESVIIREEIDFNVEPDYYDIRKEFGTDFYNALMKEISSIFKKYDIIRIMEKNLKKHGCYNKSYIEFDKNLSDPLTTMLVVQKEKNKLFARGRKKTHISCQPLQFIYDKYAKEEHHSNLSNEIKEKCYNKAYALYKDIFEDLRNKGIFELRDSGVNMIIQDFNDMFVFDFWFVGEFIAILKDKYKFKEDIDAIATSFCEWVNLTDFNSKFIVNEAILPRLHNTKKKTVEDKNIEIYDAKQMIKYRLKEIVQRYNKTPSIKDKMRKDIDKALPVYENEDFDGYREDRQNVPNLTYGICDETETSMTFLIYSGSEPMRLALLPTIKNIRKDLLKCRDISSLPGLSSISTGDGDEGCIFVTFKD